METKKYAFKKIILNVVVSKFNEIEINKIIDFARQHDFNIRLLDILPSENESDKYILTQEQIQKRFKTVKIKPKIFHKKCQNCNYVSICGEGDYLRLSARGTLDPCLYRNDLKIELNIKDDDKTFMNKIALGLRRIELDDL